MRAVSLAWIQMLFLAFVEMPSPDSWSWGFKTTIDPYLTLVSLRSLRKQSPISSVTFYIPKACLKNFSQYLSYISVLHSTPLTTTFYIKCNTIGNKGTLSFSKLCLSVPFKLYTFIIKGFWAWHGEISHVFPQGLLLGSKLFILPMLSIGFF